MKVWEACEKCGTPIWMQRRREGHTRMDCVRAARSLVMKGLGRRRQSHERAVAVCLLLLLDTQPMSLVCSNFGVSRERIRQLRMRGRRYIHAVLTLTEYAVEKETRWIDELEAAGDRRLR